MIANIGPSNQCYDDTQNTLKYANRAKNIKTNITRNVLNVEYHVSKYTTIIQQLKGEISELKNQLSQQKTKDTISTMPNYYEFDKVKDEVRNHF